MPRQRTRLSDKDFKLLKKEGMGILGETGNLFPTFGNSIEDFVKFCVYDMNDTYLKSGISEDFENDDNNIKLKPGNDLRKVGFTRGDFKIKYFFYRRLAGADEVVLTKTVGDESGIVHSGNPKLTGLPMGTFYVDVDGKVFQGEKPPVDGSSPNELDVKEYKFFIDEISADRTEVRLATQAINLDKYKDEFDCLSKLTNEYSPMIINAGTDVYGKGKFGNPNNTGFTFDAKHPEDIGFLKKYIGGTLEVEDAFIIGYEPEASTEENSSWSIEGAIPEADLRANGGRIDTVVPDEWIGYTVIYSVSNKMGSTLVPQDAVPSIYDPEDYVNSLGDLLAYWEANNVDGFINQGTWPFNHGDGSPLDKGSFGQVHWDVAGKNETGRQKKMYSHRNDMRYHWDFGCGHTELTGVPYATHTYDVSPSEIDSFTPSVTIMTPNFTYTPDTLLDRQGRTLKKVPVGLAPDLSDTPDASAPSSPLDGKIIKWDGGSSSGTPQKSPNQAATTNTRFFIQSGHRRWITDGVTLNLLRELRGLDSDSDVSLYTSLINLIPVGPYIAGNQLVGQPTGLDVPITDGYLLGSLGDSEDDSGDDDSGDDDSGDDSGTQETFYTLSVDVKYNAHVGNGFTPVDLPHSLEVGNIDHQIDAYIKIDGINVGGSYNESYLAGETVSIEIVDDSNPSDYYGHAGWAGSGTSYINTRTEVMSGDVNLTSGIRIVP